MCVILGRYSARFAATRQAPGGIGISRIRHLFIFETRKELCQHLVQEEVTKVIRMITIILTISFIMSAQEPCFKIRYIISGNDTSYFGPCPKCTISGSFGEYLEVKCGSRTDCPSCCFGGQQCEWDAPGYCLNGKCNVNCQCFNNAGAWVFKKYYECDQFQCTNNSDCRQ